MKRKDIEKILSDEAQKLEGDFGQILARISSPRSRARSGEVQAVALTHRRRNVALACVAALLILTIVAVTLGVTLGAPAPTFGITYISIGINPALSMLEARAEILKLLDLAPKELRTMVYEDVMEQCSEVGRQAGASKQSAGRKSVVGQLVQDGGKPAATAKASHKKQNMER